MNIASRVAAAATAHEVLVSGAVADQLGDDAFALRRRRRFKAKGAPRDLEVYAAERL